MRRYLIFLFYYCLFVTIALFIWSVGFAPQPMGLILVALLVPVCMYFLLTIVRRKKVAVEGEGSGGYGLRLAIPLVILATLFISTVSILMYTFVRGMTNTQAQDTNTELTKAIADLKELVAKAQSSNAAQLVSEFKDTKGKAINPGGTLGTSTSSAKVASSSADQIGFVTIADKNRTTVSVYKDASVTSSVVGRAQFGKTYFFLKKQTGWYFISLSDDLEGWVSREYVKEVSGANP